jgi:endo-1,3-1,4-beta-glycanase ExoK
MTSRTVFFSLVAAAVCVPAAAMAMASAELYGTKAYYYGRFEARIRFAPGDGVVSSFFLWKEGSDAANAFWNELDLEKFGADCSLQTNAFYGNPEKVHNQKQSLSADLCGEYHDYRFEWTSTYIAWFLDGKEIRRDTGDTATAFAQNASAGMTMHFNIWPGNSEFGGNINNTTLPVRQYISWVQYSSYNNGSFNAEWREDFQSSGIPSGWAVGNWGSPYNLSTHNTQNVAFVNGIAVLSLTADNATGNPGTPPADPAAGGTGGSGGNSGTGGTTGGAGGTKSTGGTSGSGGVTSTGGTTASGGSTATGGRTSTGGTSGLGGMSSSGGTSSSGGRTGGGGTTASGGMSGAGGTTDAGGASGAGGGPRSGGTTGSGGTTASGGSIGSGGATGSGGSSATGGDAHGGTTGTNASEGGCSCSAAPAASPLWPALTVPFVVVLRLRRKQR